MPTIHFKKSFIDVEVPDGANLRRAALDQGINVYPFLARVFNCRGHGRCGTCTVRVDSNDGLSARSALEDARLGTRDPALRLSCQVALHGDVTVETQPRIVQGWMEHGDYENLKYV